MSAPPNKNSTGEGLWPSATPGSLQAAAYVQNAQQELQRLVVAPVFDQARIVFVRSEVDRYTALTLTPEPPFPGSWADSVDNEAEVPVPAPGTQYPIRPLEGHGAVANSPPRVKSSAPASFEDGSMDETMGEASSNEVEPLIPAEGDQQIEAEVPATRNGVPQCLEHPRSGRPVYHWARDCRVLRRRDEQAAPMPSRKQQQQQQVSRQLSQLANIRPARGQLSEEAQMHVNNVQSTFKNGGIYAFTYNTQRATSSHVQNGAVTKNKGKGHHKKPKSKSNNVENGGCDPNDISKAGDGGGGDGGNGRSRGRGGGRRWSQRSW